MQAVMSKGNHSFKVISHCWIEAKYLLIISTLDFSVVKRLCQMISDDLGTINYKHISFCVWLKRFHFDFENKCFFYFDLYSTIKYISCWKYTFFCSNVATSPLCLQPYPLSTRPSTYFTYLYTFYLKINYNKIFFLHILWYSLQYIHAYTHCLEFGQYFFTHLSTDWKDNPTSIYRYIILLIYFACILQFRWSRLNRNWK